MDRLTTLMTRFNLSVGAPKQGAANFVVLGDDNGQPHSMAYFTRGTAPNVVMEMALWAGCVDWSGDTNPFLAALPEKVEFDISDNAEAQGIVEIIRNETAGARCGAGSVINRLAEVLVVRLFRHSLELGAAEPGLLAGLSDPRIGRAVVAIHDQPGHNWNNASLAQEAGLSLSRFAELFAHTMGETPMGYLRRWRLILAQQDLRRGARVETVARRYAYASAEAFSRAFRKTYGVAPISLRKGEAA